MQYLTQKTALRHGDICFLPVDEMPEAISKGQSEIHGGSHGHPHSIVKGKFYPQRSEPNILGYLKASKGAHLTHEEHGEVVKGSSLKQAPIEAGVYEVRVQVEDGSEEMREVID